MINGDKLESYRKQKQKGDIKMLNFILKLLIPNYFDYQEEMEKQMKELEREVKENEQH